MRPGGVDPSARQRSYNRSSEGNWVSFAAHRREVTARLAAAGGQPGASLGVLGAGNCNDLDLLRLAEAYASIHLLDIDAAAMQGGLAHQFATAPAGAQGLRERIRLVPCDLTGALEVCHEYAVAPTSGNLGRLRGALAVLPAVAAGGGPFTTVASTCVLSQLVSIFRRAIGEGGAGGAELGPVGEFVRLQHLRTLAALAAPGGTAILFADFVSSETEPRMLDAPAAGLAALMERVCREGGCFPGMNPAGLRRLLGGPSLHGYGGAGYWVEAPEGSAPWVWDLGPRSYLVTAITCRRKGDAGAGAAGGVVTRRLR